MASHPAEMKTSKTIILYTFQVVAEHIDPAESWELQQTARNLAFQVVVVKIDSF
jgi:hypothetical protein